MSFGTGFCSRSRWRASPHARRARARARARSSRTGAVVLEVRAARRRRRRGDGGVGVGGGAVLWSSPRACPRAAAGGRGISAHDAVDLLEKQDHGAFLFRPSSTCVRRGALRAAGRRLDARQRRGRTALACSDRRPAARREREQRASRASAVRARENFADDRARTRARRQEGVLCVGFEHDEWRINCCAKCGRHSIEHLLEVSRSGGSGRSGDAFVTVRRTVEGAEKARQRAAEATRRARRTRIVVCKPSSSSVSSSSSVVVVALVVGLAAVVDEEKSDIRYEEIGGSENGADDGVDDVDVDAFGRAAPAFSPSSSNQRNTWQEEKQLSATAASITVTAAIAGSAPRAPARRAPCTAVAIARRRRRRTRSACACVGDGGGGAPGAPQCSTGAPRAASSAAVGAPRRRDAPSRAAPRRTPSATGSMRRPLAPSDDETPTQPSEQGEGSLCTGVKNRPAPPTTREKVECGRVSVARI